MRISNRTIEEVKAKSDIVEIVGEYTRLERRGANWWGCCPFHNEKTPSFNIMPEKNIYHCFGCGGGPQENGKKEDETRKLLLELYDRTAGTFHFLLTESKLGGPARAYLQDRAVSGQTIRDFRLGFAPADRRWLHRFLRKKGYSPEFLEKSGLFSKRWPEICVFAGRLIFPIADRRGRILAFGGRILAGDGPKYINSGDLPQYKKGETLFGLHLALPHIREQKSVILCEGYMDVMAWHQAGIPNAVAPLGTAFTPEQAKLVHAFASTALLCFDTDAAGRKATYAAMLLCRETGMDVKVLDVRGAGFPDCKDPAERFAEDPGNDVQTSACHHQPGDQHERK